MLRLAALIWIVLGTTLAGVALTIIVTNNTLLDQGMKLIPIMCGAAAVIAMPLAYLIAKRIDTPRQAG